jgi:hypothetical protein
MTMNNIKNLTTARYVFDPIQDVPRINHWILSYNDDGHEIRTNPTTGSQLHFNENGEIYKMQMVAYGDDNFDDSLDGIVSIPTALHPGRVAMEGDEYALTVSQCSPVFMSTVEGLPMVGIVYTSHYLKTNGLHIPDISWDLRGFPFNFRGRGTMGGATDAGAAGAGTVGAATGAGMTGGAIGAGAAGAGADAAGAGAGTMRARAGAGTTGATTGAGTDEEKE